MLHLQADNTLKKHVTDHITGTGLSVFAQWTLEVPGFILGFLFKEESYD